MERNTGRQTSTMYIIMFKERFCCNFIIVYGQSMVRELHEDVVESVVALVTPCPGIDTPENNGLRHIFFSSPEKRSQALLCCLLPH